jgi:hypothetical protein
MVIVEKSKERPEEALDRLRAGFPYMIAGVALMVAGFVVESFCLFIWTGWPIEPVYFGRLIFAAGALFIALGICKSLRVKKFVFLVVVVLVLGADIVSDNYFQTSKGAAISRGIDTESPIAKARIERVNLSKSRISNSTKEPYAVVSWEVGGKTIRQRFALSSGSILVAGGLTMVQYSERNPRIAYLVQNP